MKKFIFFYVFFGLPIMPLCAQSLTQDSLMQQVDLGIAMGKQTLLLNLGYVQKYGVGTNNKWNLGYGLRLGWMRSFNDLEYRTASAKVRTGKQWPASWWSSDIPSQLDTFITENPGIGSLNLGLYIAYWLNPRWEAGMYVELVGFSFGGEQDGIYRSPLRESIPNTASGQPEKFNLWFTSEGTYQTEFFVSYWWPAHLGLKIGLNLYHSVYVTDQALNFDNRRFKNVSAFFTLGLGVRW